MATVVGTLCREKNAFEVLERLVKRSASVDRSYFPYSSILGTLGGASIGAILGNVLSNNKNKKRNTLLSALAGGAAGYGGGLAYDRLSGFSLLDWLRYWNKNPENFDLELTPDEIAANRRNPDPIIDDLNSTTRRPIVPGEARTHELDLNNYLRRNSIRAGRFNNWLHSGSFMSPRTMIVRNALRNMGTSISDIDSRDSIGRSLYDKIIGRRLNTVGATDSPGLTGLDSRGRHRVVLNTTRSGQFLPKWLTAIHEANHVRQGYNTRDAMPFTELSPSLADIPQIAEWYNMYRQRYPSLPFAGTETLSSDRSTSLPVGEQLRTPAGVTLDVEQMRRQAGQHGLFRGRHIAELLNTTAGRQWLNRAIGTGR